MALVAKTLHGKFIPEVIMLNMDWESTGYSIAMVVPERQGLGSQLYR